MLRFIMDIKLFFIAQINSYFKGFKGMKSLALIIIKKGENHAFEGFLCNNVKLKNTVTH